MNKTNYSEKEIYNLIAGIPDPEIPVITIEDLGILREVSIKDDKILISITPTYSGCPAMKAIENDIKEILSKHDIGPVEIKTVFSPVWTTDWISDEAKEKLRVYGISPPEKSSS
ncbi:MAG: phenylacetate-CoA oxygenase subunit PaaJ, partial [Bacteroidia bacterium]|nr:phenylacetate-CoA oxygenase subunit PaaJ [Bacteroidia bacterium]